MRSGFQPFMELESKVSELAQSMGADFFGVADLSPAREAILDQGGPMVARFPRAVSVGITLPHAIVDQLPRRADPAVATTYRRYAYDIVNRRLDHITSRMSGVLQGEGYEALPVPASQTVDEERQCGIFSHKTAAHLAGLGWIGKNCLLVTPQEGPRVRWGTVLTDAPLAVSGEPMEDHCGTCLECVEACPPGAFTGQPFSDKEPRDVRFAALACHEYFTEMEETTGLSTCGMCLYVCPFGRKAARRESRLHHKMHSPLHEDAERDQGGLNR